MQHLLILHIYFNIYFNNTAFKFNDADASQVFIQRNHYIQYHSFASNC